MSESQPPRRPLKTRQAPWARRVAQGLVRVGLTPNHISLASVLFAALAGLFLLLPRWTAEPAAVCGLYVLAGICIQLRLLCNLCDGLMAVEGGLKTKTGEIYNDLPDRVSDVLILLGAGYSITSVAWGAPLGWLAAVFALLTAYVRVLGGSAGAEQHFLGPMAKPHRMALLTGACLLAGVERVARGSEWVIILALALIVLGSAVTAARRTLRIARDLERRPDA